MSQPVAASAVGSRPDIVVDVSAGVRVPYVAQQSGCSLVFQPMIVWEADHAKYGKQFYEAVFVPSDLLKRRSMATTLIRKRMLWGACTFMIMRVLGKNPFDENDYSWKHPDGHLRVIVGGSSLTQRQAHATKVKEFLNHCWAEVCGQPIVSQEPDSKSKSNGTGDPGMNWSGSENNFNGSTNNCNGPLNNWNGPLNYWNGVQSNWSMPQNSWNGQPTSWYGYAGQWPMISPGPCYYGPFDYGQTSGEIGGSGGSKIPEESAPAAVLTMDVCPPESDVTSNVSPSTQEQPSVPDTIVSAAPAATCHSGNTTEILSEDEDSGTNASCELNRNVTGSISAVGLLSSVDLGLENLVALLVNNAEHPGYRYLVRDVLARVADVLERGEELVRICLAVRSMLTLPPSHSKLPPGLDPKLLLIKSKVRRTQLALAAKSLGSGSRNPSVVDKSSSQMKENSAKCRRSDEETEADLTVDSEDAVSVKKFLRGFGRDHLDLLKLYLSREDHSVPLRY